MVTELFCLFPLGHIASKPGTEEQSLQSPWYRTLHQDRDQACSAHHYMVGTLQLCVETI